MKIQRKEYILSLPPWEGIKKGAQTRTAHEKKLKWGGGGTSSRPKLDKNKKKRGKNKLRGKGLQKGD